MRLLIAAILLALCIAPASAHARRHGHFASHHHGHHGFRRHRAHRLRVDPIAHDTASSQLARTALRFNGARRDPTGFRGEWCGDFMGFIARLSGRRVPPGYRMAREWVHAGPRVAPQPDAVMVMSHHVGIVMRVIGRFVELISGNHGRRVGIGLYPISRAIAFVAPVRS